MSKNITKSFLENVDYLRELSKEVSKKKVKDFDSNLIYEVAYADVLLDNLIVQNNNIELSKELTEIQGVFKMILESMPEEEILKSRGTLDYKNILKQKFSDIEDASYEKSYVSNDSIMRVFLQSNLSRLVLLAVFMGIMLMGTGNFADIILSVADSVAGFMAGFMGMESSVATTPTPSMEVFETFHALFSTVFQLLLMMLVMIMSVTMTVDMLYMMIPMMRTIPQIEKMVSENTRLAVKEYYEKGLVSYSKVKDFDRIERNKVWLDTMIRSLKESKSTSILLGKLESLKTEIEVCSNKSKKYQLYARIEFLRDEYVNTFGALNKVDSEVSPV